MKNHPSSYAASASSEASILLALVSLLWAGNYIVLKIAALEIPASTLVTGRLFVAAIALWIWLRLSGAEMPSIDKCSWRRYALIALLGQVIPFLILSSGAARSKIGDIAVLIATTPLFAALASHIARKTWPRIGVTFSLAIGFIEISGFMGLSAEARDLGWRADAALLVAALSYAISARVAASLPEQSPIATSALVTSFGILMLLPLCLAIDHPWLMAPSRQALGAVVLLGCLSTAIAYVAYYRLISVSGPTFASIHHYLVPPLSVGFAALGFGESISLSQMLYGTLILASVALSSRMIARGV
jgi:drug/metabolite transporter (DMT)-like permease